MKNNESLSLLSQQFRLAINFIFILVAIALIITSKVMNYHQLLVLSPLISYFWLFYSLTDPTIKEQLNKGFNLVFIFWCISESLMIFIEHMISTIDFSYIMFSFLIVTLLEKKVSQTLENIKSEKINVICPEEFDLNFLKTTDSFNHYIKDEQFYIENSNNKYWISLINKPLNSENNIDVNLCFSNSCHYKILSKPLCNKDKQVNNLFLEYFLCIKNLFRNV